jgi:hypothetical protein
VASQYVSSQQGGLATGPSPDSRLGDLEIDRRGSQGESQWKRLDRLENWRPPERVVSAGGQKGSGPCHGERVLPEASSFSAALRGHGRVSWAGLSPVRSLIISSLNDGWEAGTPARHFQQVLAGPRLYLQVSRCELLMFSLLRLSCPLRLCGSREKWTPNGHHGWIREVNPEAFIAADAGFLRRRSGRLNTLDRISGPATRQGIHRRRARFRCRSQRGRRPS